MEEQTARAATAAVASTEHREAYGTAKTENLRDSGLWRLLLPGFIILSCLLLVGTPVIILTLLFVTTIQKGENNFLWLWAAMSVVELAVVGFIVWGLYKRFISSNSYSAR